MRDKRRLRGGFTVLDWKPPTRDPHTGILEKHAPLANYEGPRTRIQWRLAQGIKPTTHTDAAARVHDVEYSNIATRLKKGQISQSTAKQLVRASDNKLIAAARANSGSWNPVERMHSKLARTGIGLKNIAEDLGVMSEIKFLDPDNAFDEEIPEGAGVKKRVKRPKKAKKDDRVKKLRKLFEKSSKLA